MSPEGMRQTATFPGASLLAVWFAYLLIAPAWGFFWIDSWHNEQRAVEAILLAATAIFAVSARGLRTALVPESVTGFLVWAVALLGAISAFNASFVKHALAELSLYVLLGILVVVTAACVRRDTVSFLRWMRRACLVLGLIHVTGITARYAAMLALERTPDLEVLLLGYANPRFPSALYALLMPFVAMFTLDGNERPGLRRLGLTVLVLLWCVNIALGTRAIWFAYALALPLMLLVIDWRPVLPCALRLATAALAGLILYGLLFVAVPAWLGLGSALPSHIDHLTSVDDRLFLWRQSWDLIVRHPLLGVGPMNTAALGDSFASHPHNWMLQIGAEWGVPALAALLWALSRIGKSLRSKAHEDGSGVSLLGPLAAASIGLCYGLVDGNLVMPVSQVTFAVMLGTLLGIGLVGSRDRASTGRPLIPLAAGLTLAAAGFLLVYVIETLPKQTERERRKGKATKNRQDCAKQWN